MFDAPVDGRIVFGDTEFTTLYDNTRELWEGALIIRDPGGPDFEFVWQVRPDLTFASPDSLRIGGYYRRNRLIAAGVGAGLIIACGEQWPELKPDETPESGRCTTGAAIAVQVAAALDGVTLVAAVADADKLALGRWLADNQQILTGHYRLKCIETLAQGYLLGQRAAWAASGPDPVGENPWPVFEPPYDPNPMYELLGVPPLGAKAHNALYDARQVRDAWDAIHGPRIDTIH